MVTGTRLMTSILRGTFHECYGPLQGGGISERVKSTLFEKDRDIARRIQISTQDGVVTLSGNALTPQYAVNVLHDASRVDGVVKVQNHLTLD
jgi:osmotically-inducible protein OsmY